MVKTPVRFESFKFTAAKVPLIKITNFSEKHKKTVDRYVLTYIKYYIKIPVFTECPCRRRDTCNWSNLTKRCCYQMGMSETTNFQFENKTDDCYKRPNRKISNGHNRAVYIRGKISRELSHLYEHGLYKKPVRGLRKPRTSFLCRLYEQFAAYISRARLCNPRLIFPRINDPNMLP